MAQNDVWETFVKELNVIFAILVLGGIGIVLVTRGGSEHILASIIAAIAGLGGFTFGFLRGYHVQNGNGNGDYPKK